MPSKNNVWGCSLNVFVNVLLLVRPCLLIQTDRHCNLGTAKNFAQVGGKFSLTTVVRIGCQVVSLSTCNGFWHQDWSFISQVIERLRAVHEVGLVYRWALLKHFVPPVDIHSLSLVLLCKLRCIYKMHIFSRDVKPANLLFFCSPAICLFVSLFVFVILFTCQQSLQYLEQGCEARKPAGWFSWNSYWVNHSHGSQYSIHMFLCNCVYTRGGWSYRWTLAWQPLTRMRRAPTYLLSSNIFWLALQGGLFIPWCKCQLNLTKDCRLFISSDKGFPEVDELSCGLSGQRTESPLGISGP